METICSKCAMDPTSHSFKKLTEKNGVAIYYTNPTKAKLYKDTDGILSHYDNALAQVGNKKWIWIFDSENLDMRYCLTLKRALEFGNLIMEKYINNIIEIKVINPILPLRAMLKLGKPFVKIEVRKKIKVLKDRYYSVLEFL